MLPYSVTLISLLSLVCMLHISPAAGGIFDNPEGYLNATTYCIACYGDAHPAKAKSSEVRSCSELRKIIRGMRKAAEDDRQVKADKVREADGAKKRIHKLFGKKCPTGETDCFRTYSTDKRRIGFESLGCGGGPPEVPAEPKEPCQTGYIRFAGKNEEMKTCVCENTIASESVKKEKKDRENPYAYCNYELELSLGIPLGGSILLTVLAASWAILVAVQF